MTVFLCNCLCTYVNTICHYFNLSGFWKAQCLSCYHCNLSRVFCLGASHITYVNSKSKYFLFLNKLNQSSIEIFKRCDNRLEKMFN